VLFTALAINAQPYQSVFGPDTTKWTSYWCSFGAPTYYTVFVTNSDTTTINGESYRIAYSYDVCYPENISILGYMREDTLSGKLWHLPNYESLKEFLAMDLGLQKADTFNIENLPFGRSGSFIIVDSVYFEEGKKTILLKKVNSWCLKNGELLFIEGIGPGYGLEQKWSGPADALLFKHHNDSLVYTSPSFEEFAPVSKWCLSSTEQNRTEPLFEIKSVNNTSVELFIGEGNQQTALAVFDFSGRLILRQPLTEGINSIEIGKKGQYIFHIRSCCQSKSIKINL
jgi:hypothetical protein